MIQRRTLQLFLQNKQNLNNFFGNNLFIIFVEFKKIANIKKLVNKKINIDFFDFEFLQYLQ